MKNPVDERELVEYWEGDLAAVAICLAAAKIEDRLEVLNDTLLKINTMLEYIKDDTGRIPDPNF